MSLARSYVVARAISEYHAKVAKSSFDEKSILEERYIFKFTKADRVRTYVSETSRRIVVQSANDIHVSGVKVFCTTT